MLHFYPLRFLTSLSPTISLIISVNQICMATFNILKISPFCFVAAQLEACSQVQSSANTSSEDTRILQTLALVAIQLSFLTTIILSGSGSGGGMLMSCSIIKFGLSQVQERQVAFKVQQQLCLSLLHNEPRVPKIMKTQYITHTIDIVVVAGSTTWFC